MKDIAGTARAGLMVRSEFRRFLQRFNIDFVEDKGWLDSQFVFYGPLSLDQYRALQQWKERANAIE